jgi:hypothetical protein
MNAYNSYQALTLKSYFERIENLKENKFNFGTKIYLKCRSVRQSADHSTQ